MIETDEQRRWWFATHPEFSSSNRGNRKRKHKEAAGEAPETFSPEDVDAYVEERLRYATGTFAELLKAVKQTLGTEAGSSSLYQRAADSDGPDTQAEEESAARDEDNEARTPTFWDAVLKGIDDTLEDWQRWVGFGGGLVRPSRELARNLEKASRQPRPPDHVPHHIVAANDRRAAKARDLLEKKFKIGIDDADNGVSLRATKEGEGAYHPGLNTNLYHDTVYRLLRRAKSKKEAIEVLNTIGDRLSKGKFPY